MSRYTIRLTHEQVRKLNIEPEKDVNYDLAWGWDKTQASFVSLFRTVDEPDYPERSDFEDDDDYEIAVNEWENEMNKLPDECVFDIGTTCKSAGNDWAAALVGKIQEQKGEGWMPSMTLKLHPAYPDRKNGWSPEDVADLIHPLVGEGVPLEHHGAILRDQPF